MKTTRHIKKNRHRHNLNFVIENKVELAWTILALVIAAFLTWFMYAVTSVPIPETYPLAGPEVVR